MKKCLIGVSALFCFSAIALSQPPKFVKKPIFPTINYSTLTVSDIVSGKYKQLPFSQRLGLLGQVKARFKNLPTASSSQKQGLGKNGLTYYISRNALSMPASSRGPVTTRSQGQDDLV